MQRRKFFGSFLGMLGVGAAANASILESAKPMNLSDYKRGTSDSSMKFEGENVRLEKGQGLVIYAEGVAKVWRSERRVDGEILEYHCIESKKSEIPDVKIVAERLATEDPVTINGETIEVIGPHRYKITQSNGDVMYTKYHLLHREDGPAKIYNTDYKGGLCQIEAWYKNGVFMRRMIYLGKFFRDVYPLNDTWEDDSKRLLACERV